MIGLAQPVTVPKNTWPDGPVVSAAGAVTGLVPRRPQINCWLNWPPAERTALAQGSANNQTDRLIMSRLRGLGLVRVAGHDGERFPLTALGDEVSQLASA